MRTGGDAMNAPNPNSKPQPPGSQQPKSLLRNLGEFVGHIAQGIKSEPSAPQTPAAPVAPSTPPAAPTPEGTVVRQEVMEQEVLTPEGKLVLRRTIIDEVQRPAK